MDFSNFDAANLAVGLALVILLVVQNWLLKRERAWLGVFVPAVYVGLLMYLGLVGRVMSLSDFVFAALGLLGLVAWWASAREARQQKIDDDQGAGRTPWTAVDSSVSFPPSGTGVHRHSQLRIG
ncbi:MAG: hypothetical protein Q4P15_03590 [Propionibacteriaceae bacterium]|nr:hypothetical protein [Propionibacteriaceae bacterium]